MTFRQLLQQSDLLLAGGVILILAMMVIPLPPALLSLLLAFNLTGSLVILLATMYTREPLEFSVFPSLLLFTTLFNVSSTRLILLEGYAGEVIERFGEFVVGGNAVVGFIVFLILVVIQFVVITRGAERVSEVAARFTLDAMPGKQMSIDADLNAGLIDEEGARRRRRAIEQEADFYGAMDGASKFVKGDAIAAVLITIVNIVGGFVVGMVQQGLSWSDSLQRYTLLTVGDGLVSQIPALLIATATGILVTRAASESHLARDLTRQLTGHPRGLSIAAGALLLLALVPGLPKLPFLILGLLFGWLGYLLREERADGQGRNTPPRAAEKGGGGGSGEARNSPEEVAALLQVDPLEIELGYGLLALADAERGGDVMDRIGLVRRQVALDLGFVMPLVRVRDNMQLEPNAYRIRLRGVEVARGELLPERLLALDPGTAEGRVAGLSTRDPAFGLPATWIAAADRERAEELGYTVVEPAAVLATHLTRVVKERAHQILGRQEVKNLLDRVRETNPALIDELTPALVGTGTIQKVLQNLLREGVPIRDMVTILEAVADAAPLTKDPDQLTEAARQALAEQITLQLPLRDGKLRAITLHPDVERLLVEAIQPTEHGPVLALDPAAAQRLIGNLQREARRLIAAGEEPVIVCSPGVRVALRRLLERSLSGVRVVSVGEIRSDVAIEGVGVVSA